MLACFSSSTTTDHTHMLVPFDLQTVRCTAGGKSPDATAHDKIIISCLVKWISTVHQTPTACPSLSPFGLLGEYLGRLHLLKCTLCLFPWQPYILFIFSILHYTQCINNKQAVGPKPLCLVTSYHKALSTWGSLSHFRCLFELSAVPKKHFPSEPLAKISCK